MNKIWNKRPILIWKVGFLMKKIVIIIGILFIILINYEKQDYLVNDSIRFRVISNSDSAKDVLIKQKVSRKISNIIFIFC